MYSIKTSPQDVLLLAQPEGGLFSSPCLEWDFSLTGAILETNLLGLLPCYKGSALPVLISVGVTVSRGALKPRDT